MTNSSRRAFLGGLGTAAMFGATGCFSIGAKAANEKINIAFVGIGGRGSQVINDFFKYKNLFNVVAICDTEIDRPGKRPNGNPNFKLFPGVPKYQDFRKMLSEKARDLDAVVVCTPDHSHFAVTMAAMQLGKHVYVEKPMAHTFQEVTLMQAMAKKAGVVTQMGNQGHTSAHYDQVKYLAEKGFLNGVKRMDCFMNNPRRWHKWAGKIPASAYSKQAVPDWLDWNTWLTTSAYKDFNQNYLNGDWRCWYDFANGVLGDWGAHIFDCLHEFMALGMPTRMEISNIEGGNPLVFPLTCNMKFHFANGTVMNWFEGIGNRPEFVQEEVAKGVKVEASNAPKSGSQDYRKEKAVPPGKVVYLPDGTVLRGNSHDSVLHIAKGGNAALAKALKEFPRDKRFSHYGAFLHAIKGDCKAHSDFSKAGEVSKLITLGCIAQRLKVNLDYDVKANRFTNNETANQFLAIPPRKGWESFYKI